MEPWETYRTEIDEVLDLGDRVVVLPSDFGRHHGSEFEVKHLPAAIWTIRDRKVARIEFYYFREVRVQITEPRTDPPSPVTERVGAT